MRIYNTSLVPFNFLNETGMRIKLNKQHGVGMGATRPEPVPLSSLIERNLFLDFRFFSFHFFLTYYSFVNFFS